MVRRSITTPPTSSSPAFHKKGTGKASVTWPESVDEALCFGWIDGVRRSLDENSYTIRFTPRRARSIWSAKNIARFHELVAEGRVEPPGQRAFDERDVARTNQYSFEQERVGFDRARDARVPRQQEGVVVLPVTTAVVPETGDLVGRQREEGRDQGAPPRHPHRRLRARACGSSSLRRP